ncbi:MAG: hypothetical protein EH225_10420 [Calditrichaeota bacterium]|nr:MAG: hypothetical protein EH225_10420 [Calditrichota bacterium]
MEILKIDSLQQINKRLSQEITKMNAKLPSERNLSSIFATVNESASRFNLKIFRIEPGEQSGDSVNSYLAFLLETRGSFSSTVGFIHEIENCSPVFCVETITMDLVNNSRLLDTKIVLNALLKKGRNEKSEN